MTNASSSKNTSAPSTSTPSTSTSLAPIFISHGSPMLVARQSTAAFNFFVGELGRHLDGVRAILMVSAHWETDVPTISTAASQETIHDFYGFPQSLYDLRYDAHGAPELAQQIADLIGAKADDARGLDHGAWMPMILARPTADIPVFQLSMLSRGGPQEHFDLGKKLRSLRDLGVLVIASGAMTHNLRVLDHAEGPIDPWAVEFTNWMIEKTKSHDIAALLDYRERAPHARLAHPQDDHLMPFYVALGAASDDFTANLIHDSYEFGNLAMTALRFYDQGEIKTAA